MGWQPYHESLPELSVRQQELYGLVPYGGGMGGLGRTISAEVAQTTNVTKQDARAAIDRFGGDAQAAVQWLLEQLERDVANVAASMQPAVEAGEDLRGALAAREAVIQGKVPPKRARKPRGGRLQSGAFQQSSA